MMHLTRWVDSLVLHLLCLMKEIMDLSSIQSTAVKEVIAIQKLLKMANVILPLVMKRHRLSR